VPHVTEWSETGSQGIVHYTCEKADDSHLLTPG